MMSSLFIEQVFRKPISYTPLCGLNSSLLCSRVARFIDSSKQIPPLPLEPNRRFVKTPAAPDQSLPRVKVGFELWTVFDHPPVNGKVLDIDAALC